MARYASGEREAFTEVYDAVAPRLFAYLLARTRSVPLAEDLLQQTLFQMHRAHGTFISGSPVMPWAFAIAKRLVIDEQRRAQRSVLSTARDIEAGVAEPAPSELEGIMAAKQIAGRLQERLGRLPGSQRAAFELMRFEGLSHSEAAQTLGITVSALKLRAHRAYVALRSIVDDLAGPESGPVTRG
jgi:RNA polymerase sigma-70 factor (ECF subfamily)